MHDVGPEIGEPLHQFFHLLPLPALLAFEHRDGQRPKLLGPNAAAAAGGPTQQAGTVEKTVERPRRVAEDRGMLLQVDVDAAEGDAIDADVLLVGAQRRVHRGQQAILAGGTTERRPACCRAGNCRSTFRRLPPRDRRFSCWLACRNHSFESVRGVGNSRSRHTTCAGC